jgi:hypothetical protein
MYLRHLFYASKCVLVLTRCETVGSNGFHLLRAGVIVLPRNNNRQRLEARLKAG